MAQSQRDVPEPSRPARGQGRALVILAASIMAISMGLRQCFGLFLGPVVADLGASAATFGFAMAAQNLVWGISQPFLGALGDRFGARPVLVGSSAVYMAGLALMATARDPFVGLVLGGGVLVGIGVAGTGFGVLLGTVSRSAPPERRSQVTGMVSAAASLGTLALAPLTQGLIRDHGWRGALAAFVVFAACMGALSLGFGTRTGVPAAGPVALPAEGLRPTMAAAIRNGRFLAMTVAFFACGFQLAFITTHLPRYLALCGIPAGVGATALGVIGLCNAFGSYAMGHLGARFSQAKLLSLTYLFRTLAVLVYLLLPVTVPSTLLFAAAMGLMWLSVAPLVGGLIGRMFGLRHFNALFGFIFFSHQLGSFAGSWLGGVALDVTGSYDLAWMSLLAVGATAALLQWPWGQATNRQTPLRPGSLAA